LQSLYFDDFFTTMALMLSSFRHVPAASQVFYNRIGILSSRLSAARGVLPMEDSVTCCFSAYRAPLTSAMSTSTGHGSFFHSLLRVHGWLITDLGCLHWQQTPSTVSVSRPQPSRHHDALNRNTAQPRQGERKSDHINAVYYAPYLQR
jgi:hypothetical protein